MAKPSLLRFLRPKGRASRLAFLAILIGVYALWQLPDIVVTELLRRRVAVFGWQLAVAQLALALLAWPVVCMAARRLHDVNLPMWPALIYAWHAITAVVAAVHNELSHALDLPPIAYLIFNLLILVVSLALCLVPGNRDMNRYGPPPRGPQNQAADVF